MTKKKSIRDIIMICDTPLKKILRTPLEQAINGNIIQLAKTCKKGIITM